MTSWQNCKQRWAANKKDRIDDIRKLWKLYQYDQDASDNDLGRFDEYGLCFDYVPPKTFSDQREGFYRWQLSTGGPGDEFRFYASSPSDEPYRITYTLLDWFDGHERALVGKEEALLLDIWSDWQQSGAPEYAFDQAKAIQ